MRPLLFALALFASIISTTDGGLRVLAASETQVSAAAEGIFPAGAAFGGVSLETSTFALGFVIRSDGSAAGQFQTVLTGTSVLGLAQEIALEGAVTAGNLGAGDTVTFSGTGTLELGDRSLPTAVPFSATASSSGLQLTIGTTALPLQSLDLGSVFIR
jgi:hypothetical protein